MGKKSADQWFAEYGKSHRDPTNKRIHWVCVPAIVASLIGLLWEIPVPTAVQSSRLVNWASLFIVCSLIFYIRLSVPLAVGMLLFTTVVVVAILGYKNVKLGPVWQGSLLVFVVAWIGQFIGHKIEGKKPSFFQDIQFLWISPIWLLSAVYRKLGIRY